jgi:predicted nucleotidyltransferase
MTVKLEPQPIELHVLAKPKTVVDAAKDEKARQGIVKSVTDIQRAFAWPVYRHPLTKRILANRTTLHLPRSYLARDGEDTKVVYPGSDINMVVYNHYANEIPYEECAKWINFVHADTVINKR